MVRLVALAVVVAALCAAPPAQADPLTAGVETTVATTLQQATATAAAVVPAASASAPTPVQTVAETATTVAESTTATATAAAPTAPATPISAPAQPRVEPPSPSPRALSSTRNRGPVRALRAGRDRVTTAASRSAAAHERAPVAAGPKHPIARGAAPGAPRAAAVPDGRHAQDGPAPQAGAGTASGAAASFLFGGVALLAGAFILAVPRMMRRLAIGPVLYRPVVLVSSLERPG